MRIQGNNKDIFIYYVMKSRYLNILFYGNLFYCKNTIIITLLKYYNNIACFITINNNKNYLNI